VEHRNSKDVAHHQNNLDKLNPSITLNDKSVDPRVLKALKAGQMRMPVSTMKGKGRQLNAEQHGQAKRKKEDASMQQSRNILDLSGTKKMDLHPLRIPTPLGKFKVKSPNWVSRNIRRSI
jgi:polycomb group RING finger protein 4